MYDIFYIGKKTEELSRLKALYPFIKYVETFDEAKKFSYTKMFWIIWDDIKINDAFDFTYSVPEWDQEYVHLFKNKDFYDGVCLIPKNKSFSKREIEYRFFTDKKENDLSVSVPVRYDRFEISTYDEYLEAVAKSSTNMFWCIWNDVLVDRDFKFDYQVPYHNQHITHVFKNGDRFDGICLFSKNKTVSKKEFEYRFFTEKKEIDVQASVPKPYDKFVISNYDEYLEAVAKSSTNMFWCIWNDVLVDRDFKFDYQVPYHNQHITHVFKNGDRFDGICLFSKNKTVSKKEFEYRFFTEKKEIDVQASVPKPYDKFVISNYDEYLQAYENSSTSLFWTIPKEVEIINDFNFPAIYERNVNHMFGHNFRGQKTFNGLMLLSKIKKVSKKEIDFRFIVERVEHDEIVTKLRSYDIVFISYNEPDADKNYEKLIEKFPRAKRVHGVKGIHNAHIEAAKLSDTEMFWVVDGDAVILDDFKFDHEVSRYDINCVHIWHSRNPINGLVYGYGGVKLLPKQLTIDMDQNSADMTTSISKDIKVVPEVSNITGFNTDPFNTWKSAFRECAKLASRTIAGQINKETEERLSIWTTVGSDREFGNYAIAGAIAGRTFAENHPSDINKINDFAWLEQKFSEENIL